jgi:uncharacterized membrane protein
MGPTDDREIEGLATRVQLLEHEVEYIRGYLWQLSGATAPPRAAAPTQAPSPAPAPPASAPARPAAAPTPPGFRRRTPVQPAPAPWQPPYTGQAPYGQPAPYAGQAPSIEAAPAPEARTEAAFAGTWFARGGALAVLIGAGFAFQYGVDRGLITEPMRVLIGLLAGLAFVAWGVWARRRGWVRLSQAVTGGGIAICYLSVLVADLSYHLISNGAALGFLVLVAAGGAALAYAYDSVALAMLATIGAFLNPLLTAPGGRAQPVTLFSYLAIVDAGVFALALLKRWRPLEALAMAGTWLLFIIGLGAGAAGFGTAMGFATAYVAGFTAIPFARDRLHARETRQEAQQETWGDDADGALVALNALAYFGVGMALLGRGHGGARGEFTFALALAFAGLAWLAGEVTPANRVLRNVAWGISLAAATVAMALQFHRFALVTAWAAEGVAVTWLGMRARSVPLRTAGAAVLGAGAALSLALLPHFYRPAHLMLSLPSGQMVLVIAALAAAAYLFSRDEDPDSRRFWYPLSAVCANAVAVAWLSAEAAVHYHGQIAGAAGQPLLFSLSAIWALYAGALLAIGVATRLRWARLAALGLFTITMAKMLVLDLWTLSTGERVLAFIGLGALLLGCSVLYHKYKDLILGTPNSPAGAPGDRAGKPRPPRPGPPAPPAGQYSWRPPEVPHGG